MSKATNSSTITAPVYFIYIINVITKNNVVYLLSFRNWTCCSLYRGNLFFRLNDVVTPLWRMPYQQQLEVCLTEVQYNFLIAFTLLHFFVK